MGISGLKLWQWRVDAKTEAVAANIEPAEVDWLLQEVSSLDRLTLRLESFKIWHEVELKLPFESLEKLWNRRITERVPVQYLIGKTPWRNYHLNVSPAVLIPRPETELMIEIAKGAGVHLKTGHWADLGTGSGAIAIGLADEFPQAMIHAVDYSKAALFMAQKNAQECGFANQIQFYQGSWFEPLEALKGQLSAMVSNPPYIPNDEVLQLQPEVTKHEPHLALAGGKDGLDCIRHLVSTAPQYLHPGGIWLIEMMAGQAEAVTQLLKQQGCYKNISIIPDLAGIERFALANLIGK
jgi:release factor glutamine methyltransferase